MSKVSLNSFLSFSLGDELFAVNVGKVLEILEIPRITKVPRAPEYMRGVINLRGSVLPVIDTRCKLGLPAQDDTVNSSILVINVQLPDKVLALGAIVDSVQEVIEFDNHNIQPLPSIGAKYKTEFIDGMYKLNEQFIMIVNLEAIFSTEDIVILEDAAEENAVL